MVRKNFYIQILKYAHEKEDGFISDEIFEALSMSKLEKQLFNEKVINELKLLETVDTRQTEHGNPNVYSISSEGRFRLLSYEQYESASKAANIAIWIAIASLLITALSFITGILIKNDRSFYPHGARFNGYVNEAHRQWCKR